MHSPASMDQNQHQSNQAARFSSRMLFNSIYFVASHEISIVQLLIGSLYLLLEEGQGYWNADIKNYDIIYWKLFFATEFWEIGVYTCRVLGFPKFSSGFAGFSKLLSGFAGSPPPQCPLLCLVLIFTLKIFIHASYIGKIKSPGWLITLWFQAQ